MLAYFDIRGNPADLMTLPDGEKLPRADAIKRLRSSPVPAWMFVSAEGKEFSCGAGRAPRSKRLSVRPVVTSNAYQSSYIRNFLAQRGLREAEAARVGALERPEPMVEMWRVIDTGLRAAAQNIALDRALLEARNAEEIASTLRFYRVAPAVLSREPP